MDIKKPILAGVCVLAALSLTACSVAETVETAVTEVAQTVEAEVSSTGLIADHDDPADYVWDEADEIAVTLSDSGVSADTDGVSVDGSTVTITSAGTYRLSGSLSNGQIVVNTQDTDLVRLILDGVDIACSDSAPVYVLSAEKVVINLATGSTNSLSDGSDYIQDDAEEDEPNATVFSKSNLTIFGDGSLTVEGNYNDGIASKDGLIIAGGNITVDAVDDAIRGKDYLVIKDGDFTITSGGQGLKSDNEDDDTVGYISVSGGTFDINATDDAVHSNNTILISGGSFDIATGDDGVHADNYLEVSGGTIDITKSYEGLESANITINDGIIDIVSSDDGLNCAGGNDGSGTTQGGDTFGGGRGPGGGGGGMDAVGDYYLEINGGTITVNAEGDGLDSNGYITVTGGTIVVHGPSRGGNGALDCNGTFEMTGGELVAASTTSDMFESISSGQAAINITMNGSVSAGSVIHIETEDGESVLTFVPEKAVGALVYTSPDLVAGETYNVYFGGSASGDNTGGLYAADAYTAGELAGTIEAE